MKIDGRDGPARDPAYLDWIRKQPCVLCGARSEAHHLKLPGQGRMGKKPDDYFAVPLCRTCHRTIEMHRLDVHELLLVHQFALSSLVAWVKETWGE